MSRTKLTTATMTPEQADDLFDRLARNVIALDVDKAKTKKRIADIKANHKTRVEELAAKISADQARLEAFINAHPEYFKKPKKRTTDFGTFGLQLSTRTEVVDEEKAVAYLLEAGYTECLDTTHSVDLDEHPDALAALRAAGLENCIETTHKILATPLKDRMSGKEEIPGVRVDRKDRPGYKVDNTLKKTAKGAA